MNHPLYNADDAATSWALNPWHPMSKPIDLKHLGKLAEELNEAGAAVSRCIIQGIDECEPITRKPNKQWLEDELADVIANIELVRRHFKLDLGRMEARAARKIAHLKGWHSMLAIALLFVLAGCKDFDEGGAMRADVTRAQHDRCEIVVYPMWSDRVYVARLKDCAP